MFGVGNREQQHATGTDEGFDVRRPSFILLCTLHEYRTHECRHYLTQHSAVGYSVLVEATTPRDNVSLAGEELTGSPAARVPGGRRWTQHLSDEARYIAGSLQHFHATTMLLEYRSSLNLHVVLSTYSVMEDSLDRLLLVANETVRGNKLCVWGVLGVHLDGQRADPVDREDP